MVLVYLYLFTSLWRLVRSVDAVLVSVTHSPHNHADLLLFAVKQAIHSALGVAAVLVRAARAVDHSVASVLGRVRLNFIARALGCEKFPKRMS